MNIFFSFAPIQALIELSVFNRFTFIFTVSRAVYLDLRVTIPLVAYAPMVSSILSIISEVMKKNSTRMVRKRKYPRYFDSCLLFPLPHYSRTRKKRREEERRIIIKYQQLSSFHTKRKNCRVHNTNKVLKEPVLRDKSIIQTIRGFVYSSYLKTAIMLELYIVDWHGVTHFMYDLRLSTYTE